MKNKIWKEYELHLPGNWKKNKDFLLPKNLFYYDIMPGVYDYVLPEEMLNCLREYLTAHFQDICFYIFVEITSSMESEFRLKKEELNTKKISKINDGMENIICSSEFDWAIYTDHEGVVRFGGPFELFECLRSSIETN